MIVRVSPIPSKASRFDEASQISPAAQVGQNADGAGEWLKANPASPLYDRMAASYSAALWTAAEAWALTIKDQTSREETLSPRAGNQ
jgi:hypothetical protein